MEHDRNRRVSAARQRQVLRRAGVFRLRAYAAVAVAVWALASIVHLDLRGIHGL